MIFNTVGERKIWIEIGYGLEGILPDGLVGEIRDRYVIPYLKKGDYGNGHLMAVVAIARVIARDYGVQLTGNVKMPVPLRATKTKKSNFVKFITMIFFFFLILASRGRILPWLLLGSLFGSGHRSSGWGGFGGGGFGGGFGGFGGGMSGGGGAGGSY